MKFYAKKPNIELEAAHLLMTMRMGIEPIIDNLEVIDKILSLVGENEELTIITTDNKVLSKDLAIRLRFERGLDIRG